MILKTTKLPRNITPSALGEMMLNISSSIPAMRMLELPAGCLLFPWLELILEDDTRIPEYKKNKGTFFFCYYF